MTSPQVAGVAALIVSRYGDANTPQNGKLRPGQVAALPQHTADPQDCPRHPAGLDRFVLFPLFVLLSAAILLRDRGQADRTHA